MMGITPTPEQAQALDKIEEWYRTTTTLYEENGSFLLDGGAGVGKTLTASLAVERLAPRQVLFAAYTAKAARVMAQKGMKDARTLHSILYRPVLRDGVIIDWVLVGDVLREAQLLVVDECSMVTEKMANEIRSFGVPTLVLGDIDGQLPPLKGSGAFTNKKPDFRLTEPHRTAMNSPIDRLAWTVRKGGQIHRTTGDGEAVIVKSMMDPTAWDHITDGNNVVICGKHKTRFAVTRRNRTKLGFSGEVPLPGEPIICCRNDRKQCLINGDMGVVWRISENKPHLPYFIADLIIEGDQRSRTKICRHLFEAHFDEELLKEPEPQGRGALFDWGYAITAHKAQGSEWPNVCVIDDQFMRWDRDMRRRWLYTAVTRASEKLIVLQTTA